MASTHSQFETADRVPRLHPIVPLDGAAPAAAASRQGKPGESPYEAPGGSDVMVVGPDRRRLEVHYALDQVANVWVAAILDRETGELVRTVPSTRVLHQLAELNGGEHGRVDARA